MKDLDLSKYQIAILRPGGNDTALVKGIVPKSLRKQLNDAIMASFPNVEQVGFYEYDKDSNLGRLEMAGGEFCGNATRSLAYLLLRKKGGSLKIKVSGSKLPLVAGSRVLGEAFAQMPILPNPSSVREINKELVLVRLRGITHLLTPKPSDVSPEKLKRKAKMILKKMGLLNSQKAAGVMFFSRNLIGEYRIEPVVWVRDIQTLFYETACASGTTALGLWLAKNSKDDQISIKVRQPSQELIKISISKEDNNYKEALIDGPIKYLRIKND